MSEAPRIFFKRSYTYRKPSVLIASLLALGFGGFGLWRLAAEFPPDKWTFGAVVTIVLVGGVGGILALAGGLLLRKWFSRTRMDLEISDAGVRYGGESHSWEKIHWISGHAARKRIRLFYQLRGNLMRRSDRIMPVDPNLTPREFEVLMNDLSTELSEKHPELTIG